MWHDWTQKQNFECFYAMSIHKNHFKKQNVEQTLIKKHKKFQNFEEIFYCGMTRVNNMNLGVFMQCQYRRKILRNKNMAQSLLKKHSKFQKLD